jgi:hypothetical protein
MAVGVQSARCPGVVRSCSDVVAGGVGGYCDSRESESESAQTKFWKFGSIAEILWKTNGLSSTSLSMMRRIKERACCIALCLWLALDAISNGNKKNCGVAIVWCALFPGCARC